MGEIIKGKTIGLGIISGIVLTIVFSLEMFIPGSGEWYQQVFPEMMTLNAVIAMIFSIFVVGFFMGVMYTIVDKSLPYAKAKKGAFYGLLIWLVAGTMWPIMVVGFGPMHIWLTDLIAGLVSYALTGIVIAKVHETL